MLPFTQPGGGALIPVQIQDMESHHRLAVLRILRGLARRLKQQEVAEFMLLIFGSLGPSGDMARDACDDELQRLIDEPSSEWIEHQSLVQALVRWTTPVVDDPRLPWRPVSDWTLWPKLGVIVLVQLPADVYSNELRSCRIPDGTLLHLDTDVDFTSPVLAYRDSGGGWAFVNGVRMPVAPVEWTELLPGDQSWNRSIAS